MSGCPRLALYCAKGLIHPVQRMAGDAFREDYLMGCSTRHRGQDGIGSVAPRSWVDMHAIARDRARRALGMLGRSAAQVLVAVVVLDRTSAEAAEELGWRSTSVMDVLDAALWQLVRVYDLAPLSAVPPVWQRAPELALEDGA